MTPEQYQRVGELFDELRDLSPQQQAQALEQKANGDAALQQHVTRLLEADRKASQQPFLQRNALADAAELLAVSAKPLPLAGTQVGNYRIGTQIGAGGMGVVYDAEDLRLPRRVAVKLLPQQAFGSENTQRVQRFEREAHTASQLNHPHIVSILDAAFDHGFYYIAMEFVEGRTLRSLINDEKNGLDQATILDVLSQVASALIAAHQAGIVHRDIKPENIMVRPDGFVKVLDFGLASVRDTSTNPVDLSTRDLRTRHGSLLGTIQYLSPEQVLGKPATARSDLFSLGVVAYELATGIRPFDGPTDGAVFDAILNESPIPPSAIRATVSEDLQRMILQLLEKDPDLRIQTASDLRSFCKRLSRDSSHPIRIRRAFPITLWNSRAKTALWTSLAAVAGAGLMWLLGLGHRTSDLPLPVHFEQLTEGQGEENFPSASPDGKQFVYASHRSGNWDIFLQRTGGRTYVNLTHDSTQDDTEPALSPDGSHIAFRSEREGGGLYVMETTGENPRRVSTEGYLPAWSPDNQHLVYSAHNFTSPGQVPAPPSRLFVINLDDNSTRQLNSGEALQPSWSPHGSRIAYWGILEGGQRDIFTIAADNSSAPVAVTDDPAMDWNPVWAPSGRELYFLSNRGGSANIWRIAIDERTGRTSGIPEPVTVPATSVGSLALTGDGKALIFSNSSKRTTLARIAFDPVQQTATGTPESLGEGQTIFNFTFSPDGSQLVYDTIGADSENLWIVNADGTHRRSLTTDNFRNRAPSWSPRGDEIMFYSDRSGHYDDWVIRTDGSGLRPLTNGAKLDMQNGAWSPDGRQILAGRFLPDLILDAHAANPIRTANEAVRVLKISGLFCSSWTDGPDGSMAACDLFNKGNYEAAAYSPATQEVMSTGKSGASAFWAPATNRNEIHRALIFADGSRCWRYDRETKQSAVLFSVEPNRLICLVAAPNGKHLYFSQNSREADLWLATFSPLKN